MARSVTQRQLRNASGEIMRGLDRGESFVNTRNGFAVGELRPLRRSRFVSLDQFLAAFSGSPAIDAAGFRRNLDALVDQNPAPRS